MIKKTVLSDTHPLKRFVSSILVQIPWFTLFSALVWYGKKNTAFFLERSFDLWSVQKNASFLQGRTDLYQKALSLTSPSTYADYIASLTASTFSTARVTTMEQTIHLLSFLFESGLTLIWFLGAFYAVLRIFKSYRRRTTENDIANLVVAKLVPILEEMTKKNTP